MLTISVYRELARNCRSLAERERTPSRCQKLYAQAAKLDRKADEREAEIERLIGSRH